MCQGEKDATEIRAMGHFFSQDGVSSQEDGVSNQEAATNLFLYDDSRVYFVPSKWLKRNVVLVAAEDAFGLAEAQPPLRPAGQFRPVDVELFQRPVPLPALGLHEAHDQKVFQLLDFSKAVALGRV